ncbi:unnamed protein product [Amoebophrya sp. A25]|nr:unnamed protein product [Amoebophrya sp. A25]|eukprot:GSA25T00024802001.1
MSSPMNGHSEAPTGAANGGGSPSPAAHLSPARSPQLKVGTSAAGPSSGSPKRSQPSSPAFRERSPRREGAVSPLPNSPSNRRMSIPPEQGEQQLQMDVEDAAAGQPEEPFPEILDEFAVEEAEGAAPPEGAEGAAPPDGAEAAAPPEGAEGADAAMEGAEGAAKEEAAPAAPPEPIKPAHIYQTIDDGKVYCFAEKDDDGRPIWHYQDEGGPEMKDLYYCQVVLKSHVEAKDEQGNAIGADTDPGNWIKMLNQDLPLLQQTLGIEIPGAENETAIPGQPIKQQIALFAFDEPNDFMEINRPDAKKIASRLAKGDRRWAVVSDMFEEDRDFLVKRFRHIMHRDIRDWLKALLADGEKQNLLYRTPGAEFKKRFQLDTEKHKFPNCPIFLKSQMTEMFQSQDAISDFLLDCDTGTEKSFVVIIKPDAWTAYLTKCGCEPSMT